MNHHGWQHLYTAYSYYVIGACLLALALRIWLIDPFKRAPLVADFLTPKGLQRMLRGWPFVFLFGVFIFACAVDHHAGVAIGRGQWARILTHDLLDALSTFETIASGITAACVLWVTVRLWPTG